MRRYFLSGLAAVSALALAAGPAAALRIAVMPNASTRTKVIQSEAVVVGKVAGIDGETVELEQHPGGPKAAFMVANVKIESGLVGVKNATHLKLAFVKPQAEAQPGGPGPGKPFVGRGGPQAFIPAQDQEGVYFLQKHPTSDNHYIVLPNHPPLLSADAKYKDELAAVKGLVAALADPVKALSAEKDEERVANALSLAQKYRSAPMNKISGVFDETPVPAEQTKLFLKILTDVDWTKHADAPRVADALGLMPGNYGIPRVFAADGEEPMAARQKAFKAWAEKYGAKFEVKKVSAKPVEKPTDGPGATPAPPVIRR